ncbi:NUDIX domain-containing protein [Microbacterium gorillae]|uniref:NUDIX domain-containing protein n=1 Tax=Microbacterium gorillae TaxID=1231063 RepID=UPI000591504E|nr:NUDIX hydrolase [Microbacterium gorillae]
MTWQTRTTRTVYENRWISVREDEVTGPGGDGIYGVVTMRRPSVFVVALDEDDRVCLVTLERYATRSESIEVPGGGTDGEEPLRAAQRELAEETGLFAAEWTAIGRMDALNGIANAPEHVFLARGLSPAAFDVAASDEQRREGITRVSWVPFAEVLDLARTGAISDGETLAALFLAALHLGRVS